jgi:adenylate cyclase
MTLDKLEWELAGWLVERGLEAPSEAEILDGLCTRLVEGGVPVWRAATGLELLHPLLDARGCRWLRGEGIVKEDYTRGGVEDPDDEEWRRSPFYHLAMVTHEPELRRRLDDGSYRRGEFPLLDAFQDHGSTDYVAFSVDYGAFFGRVRGMLCSYQTDRRGGFEDAEVRLLRAVARPLGLAFKTLIAAETARTLACTYLGANAAERVLEGAIVRGRPETVRAALWYSDLEGFTRIADTAPADALIGFLNDYAETVVSQIHAHGGQVLKFMGDGILAMFPLENDAGPCGCALDAAEATLVEIDRLRREREAKGALATGLHLALHVGEVLYGNIGSRDRLDFTVVGPAVNEVARIEALCRSLEQRVIVSSAFAAEAGADRRRLVSLGRYALKGVRRPEELFTLDSDAASSDAPESSSA